MKEPIFVAWGICLLISAVLMLWISRRQMRPLSKYAGWLKIGLMLVTFGISWLLYYFLRDSPHLIWSGRLAILALGALDVWLLYQLRFSKRDRSVYEQDSFLLEYLVVLFHAFIVALMFATAPQITNLVDIRAIDVSIMWWDIPLVFLLPFLFVKLLDFASQTPYKDVENRWIYPMQPAVIDQTRWYDFVQVRFKIKDGMRKEYKFGSLPEKPWIQVPRKYTLGDSFRLTMQERRKESSLAVINDLGDEHGGSHRFWWLFRKAVVWYNPLTWFRRPRYLNPDYSIEAIDIRPYDYIVARRVPAGAGFTVGQTIQEDPDKDVTVLIHR